MNKPRKPKGRIADLVTLASWLSGIDRKLLVGKTRKAKVVRIRMAIYLVASEYGWSTPKIGAVLRKDHSSVLHGRRKAIIYTEYEPAFALFVDQLRVQAEDMTMFIEDRDRPQTVEVIKWSKPIYPPAKKPKNDFSANGVLDEGHLFHKNIGKGTDKLTQKLREAMG